MKSLLVSAIVVAACAVVLLSTQPAQAQTFKVLYSFTGAGDGGNPYQGMIRDGQGNLYGATTWGGAFGYGAIFKLDTKGIETVLYSFCPGGGECLDGENPYEGVIMDAGGNLYGSTTSGGSGGCFIGCGVVFMLSPTGVETVLHTFCPFGYGFCNGDGAHPTEGLILDSSGNLYGTTYQGGIGNCFNGDGCGVVFKLTPSQTGNWTETVLYSFTGAADGASPQAGVIRDVKGNLYGTTYGGGNFNSACTIYGCGVVFKLNSSGSETVLYKFCSQSACGDGVSSYAGLIMDATRNLYGTTYLGGNPSCRNGGTGCGVVFKLSDTGAYTALYTFTGGTDGANSRGGVVLDGKGNLYGTTTSGGNLSNCTVGCGVVFKLTPTGQETVLHTFMGTDGAQPDTGVIRDTKGNLYGVTFDGGITGCSQSTLHGCGTVFKVVP